MELTSEQILTKFDDVAGTLENFFGDQINEVKNVYLILSGYAIVSN